MGDKYLFLFDRLYEGIVDGKFRFYCGCAIDDENGLAAMAQEITERISHRANFNDDDFNLYRQEILESLKCLDYTCIAEDFFAELETFGLILVSSFKDLPTSPRAVFQ